jgi:hypothetical protein
MGRQTAEIATRHRLMVKLAIKALWRLNAPLTSRQIATHTGLTIWCVNQILRRNLDIFRRVDVPTKGGRIHSRGVQVYWELY